MVPTLATYTKLRINSLLISNLLIKYLLAVLSPLLHPVGHGCLLTYQPFETNQPPQ